MDSNPLANALRLWAESAPDSLFTGSDWIIACWQARDGRLAVSGLLAATYSLDPDAEATAPAFTRPQVPDAWLGYALDFDGRVFDLVTKRPASSGHLAGVGLVKAKPGTRDDAVVLAWMATGEAAIRVELHRYADAVGRCEVGDPLWWDQQDLFEPLERYRAAACGWPPALPTALAIPDRSERPSTAAWAGPC
jgi:hypothetical protein